MNENLTDLVKVCQWMNSKDYSPATSGNYSLRIDENSCYVSASGVDKGNLRVEDFTRMNLDGTYDERDKKPSDEALVHTRIYQLHPEAKCVLHAHSVSNTVFGLITKEDFVEFQNFEMQKAFTTIMTHEEPIRIKIHENTQDIHALAKSMTKFDMPCFILRGHGVYAWGNTMAHAKRHLEGIEFLIACKLEMMKVQK